MNSYNDDFWNALDELVANSEFESAFCNISIMNSD